MPTRCASVNYCGTQAPIWLRLDDDQQLPDALEQVELTGCSTWSRHQDGSDESMVDYDCCAMKYPIIVRNCSSYLIYQLQPTQACNMAYCAQLPFTSGMLTWFVIFPLTAEFGSSVPYKAKQAKPTILSVIFVPKPLQLVFFYEKAPKRLELLCAKVMSA